MTTDPKYSDKRTSCVLVITYKKINYINILKELMIIVKSNTLKVTVNESNINYIWRYTSISLFYLMNDILLSNKKST